MGKNLATERISKSYQRLLQIDPDDNTTVLDGTGSNVTDLVFSSAITSSGILSTKGVILGELSSAPSQPGEGTGYLFASSSNKLFWETDAGVIYDLTTGSGGEGWTGSVAEDGTPQLGGDFDLNGFDISGSNTYAAFGGSGSFGDGRKGTGLIPDHGLYVSGSIVTVGSMTAGSSSNSVIGSTYSSILGGYDNTISGSDGSIIGAGKSNTISGSIRSTIVAGDTNTISYASQYSIIGGGFENEISYSLYSIIGAGRRNTSFVSSYSIIGSGTYNKLGESSYSIIGAGRSNTISGSAYSAIVAGQTNIISESAYSMIGAGYKNTISGSYYSIIGGGYKNYIKSGSSYSIIGAGGYNTMSGSMSSSILGGTSNHTADYDNVHIIGSNISASQANTTFTENIIADGDISASGDLYFNIGSGLQGFTRTTMSIDSDTTFTAADSGKFIYITHASTGTTHELPAVADCIGCEFEFIMQVSRTADIKFDSQATDSIRGFSVSYGSSGQTTGSYISDRYIIYDESLGAGNNGQIGDRMKLTCDGTYYYLDAVGVVLPGGTEPKWSGSST